MPLSRRAKAELPSATRARIRSGDKKLNKLAERIADQVNKKRNDDSADEKEPAEREESGDVKSKKRAKMRLLSDGPDGAPKFSLTHPASVETYHETTEERRIRKPRHSKQRKQTAKRRSRFNRSGGRDDRAANGLVGWNPNFGSAGSPYVGLPVVLLRFAAAPGQGRRKEIGQKRPLLPESDDDFEDIVEPSSPLASVAPSSALLAQATRFAHRKFTHERPLIAESHSLNPLPAPL
ncbi:hypothetical protein BDK51DRAFT_34708 [Blyttiomyces helicus]|uniref:Uncharacterized protein n=1 Tax=Blyttiomyces helicus TaxID=388810 RepID=A0A4P9W3T0_9FUNG|nr:hypothetical protein BDK51DRAFT_34708 [Blyttiomyces helicus]|eukprot:RKO84806.1 hypothetical protein BDK51DRAFT_34708 [Blyttiomyces helicus]